MAATVSGGKSVTKDLAPHLTGSVLTTLLATAPEELTVAQLNSLVTAISRVPKGGDPTQLLKNLLV